MNELSNGLLPALHSLLEQAGLPPPLDARPLLGGGNNQVYRVTAGPTPLLLKVYFRHPGDTRDRLAAEFAFVRFAWDGGLRQVPRPLAADLEHGLGLYDLCPGCKLLPGEVDADAVRQAADFCVALNRHRDQGRHLPDAAESCFTIAAHLQCVERRLNRLAAEMTIETDVDRQARALLQETVLPAWQRLRERTERLAHDSDVDPQRRLAKEATCISPSDFGFHNALRDESGHLHFLDFEYAGWDDPAKLVCDFFCQPTVPVPLSFYSAFVDRLSGELSDSESLRARSDLLLPVYQMKWVTILLNEFLPIGDRRRRFAQPGVDWDARKREQLDKARNIMEQSREG